MDHTPFQVDLSGIIKILSDHLYSQKEVFIRELLQNAVDAIHARTKKEPFDPIIQIEYYENPEGSGYIISDNGIGLTHEQIIAFLAKIGSSSKASQYEEIRTDFIGQFGIGILSCFMVADDIVLITKSKTEETVLKWTGNIDGTYAITTVEQDMPVGTKVILKLRKEEPIPTEQILHAIQKYGGYLPVPIMVEANGGSQGVINRKFPWEKQEQSDEILRFGTTVFKEDFRHYIVLKNPETNLPQGILYIMPRAVHRVAHLSGVLHVKNMFVTHDLDGVLPNWAVFIKPMINASQLSLTASREQVYHNEESEALTTHIETTIKNYFFELGASAPHVLHQIIRIHSIALKQIALTDPTFLKFIYKWFTFPTTQGTMTLEAIQATTKTIYHVPDVDEFRQIIPIAKANSKLVINSGYIYDADLLHEISHIDNEMDYIEINAAYFGNFLGEISLDDDELYRNRLEELQSYTTPYDCTLLLKSFEPTNIPTIYHIDLETLSARDIEEIKAKSTNDWASISNSLQGESTNKKMSRLYLNIKNKMIRSFLQKPSVYDKTIIETLYTNAMLMGHYALDHNRLEAMNLNFNTLIQLALSSD